MKSRLLPQRYRNLPLLTMAVASCSLLISSSPLSRTLQYDRAAIAGGDIWLLLTGHLSHWSPDHLLWDILVFIVLGVMTENRSRQGFILCITGSAFLISGILWFRMQDMDCYRGLSGLDSALFGFTALWMVRERFQNENFREAVLILCVSAGFLGKIIYESYSLESVFTASAGIFTPVPLAHLAGALVGIVAAMYFYDIDTNDENTVDAP